jgi:hypothetical protein
MCDVLIILLLDPEKVPLFSSTVVFHLNGFV